MDNDQYARQKAETVAQLHRQAYNDYANRQLQGAGVAGNLGNINMGQQAAAEVPFNVHDEIVVGDLTDVRQEIMPVTQNVKVRIAKASVKTSEDKALKSLNLELKIVDGVSITNQDTGEVEIKFQNKSLFPGFMDVCIWADSAVKNSNWYKNKQYLLGFKQFCQAVGKDLKDVKVNDEFLTELIGKELLISIRHEEETVLNLDTGKREKTGSLRERIGSFRKAE